MNFFRNIGLTPLIFTAATLLATCVTPAHATRYSDSVAFSRTGQDMWGDASNGWDYNTFFGGNWGTYAGNNAETFSVNAIAGSPRATIIPGIPDINVPGTPAVVIPGFCIPILGCTGAKTVIPAIPGFTIPGTPTVYGDTRTGFASGVSTSGKVGVTVSASSRSGSIDLSVPVQATLDIPNSFISGQQFGVVARATPGAGSYSTKAPSFEAGIYGVTDMTNRLYATGCFLGAGCSDSSSNANINFGQFPIVGIDTAKTVPLSVAGLSVPLVASGKDMPIILGGQTLGHVTVSAPQNTQGGVMSGGNVTLKSNQTVLNMAVDVTGLMQNAMGLTTHILQPTLDLKLAKVQGTLVNVQAGINFGLSQELNFNPAVKVTLTFDQPVTTMNPVTLQVGPSSFVCLTLNCPAPKKIVVGYEAGLTDTSVTFATAANTFEAGAGTQLMFRGPVGKLVSRSYSLDGSMLSDTVALSIDPDIKIQAACFEAFIIGVISTGNKCAFTRNYATTDLSAPTVFSKSFAVNGFSSTIKSSSFGSSGDFDVPAVPEPSTWAMFMGGLLLVAACKRRKAS